MRANSDISRESRVLLGKYCECCWGKAAALTVLLLCGARDVHCIIISEERLFTLYEIGTWTCPSAKSILSALYVILFYLPADCCSLKVYACDFGQLYSFIKLNVPSSVNCPICWLLSQFHLRMILVEISDLFYSLFLEVLLRADVLVECSAPLIRLFLT
jgi:hypothetical protein